MLVLRVYLILSVIILPSCLSANILAIIPTPSHSHQVAFTAVWKELSLRGHKVTVFTTDPQNNPKLTNLTEVDLKWSYQYFSNLSSMAENTITMWNGFDIFSDIMTNVADGQLSSDQFKKIMQPEQKFDVLLVECIYPELLALAQIYDCPKILIASFDPFSFIHRYFGNPSHPILNPDFLTTYYDKLTFNERVISTIYDVYLSLYQTRNFFHKKNLMLRKYFNTKSAVEELIADADMLFVNADPILQNVRSLGPATINIGGYQRNTSMRSLPKVRATFCHL